MNEPDWVHEEDVNGNSVSGNARFSWQHLQNFFARNTVAIRSRSDVLVTVGMAMPKYNSTIHDGNMISDANLQSRVSAADRTHAALDFWSPHYYDWMGSWTGNPFTVSPYGARPGGWGLDNSKPALIGEVYGGGTEGRTMRQDYEGAFANGWQGVMAWTSNGSCGAYPHIDMRTIGVATRAILAAHPQLVFPTIPNGGGTTPTHGISLSQTATLTFPSAAVGFGEQPTVAITVTNTGNQPTGALTVTAPTGFTIGGRTGMTSGIAAGATREFTINPSRSLNAAPGVHSGAVTVTGANGITATFNVSFTVTGEGETLPTTEATSEPSEPTSESTEPTSESTEPSSDAPTEPSTDPSSDAPTEPSTEPSSDAPTEPSTEPSSDAPTEPSTDPSSDAPTEPSSEPSEPSSEPSVPSTDPSSDVPPPPTEPFVPIVVTELERAPGVPAGAVQFRVPNAADAENGAAVTFEAGELPQSPVLFRVEDDGAIVEVPDRVTPLSTGQTRVEVDDTSTYILVEIRRGHVLGRDTIEVADAIAILRYLVELPSALDNNEIALKASLIVNPNASAPVPADAIAILRRLVELPSALDD
jgi:hypothetical protein